MAYPNNNQIPASWNPWLTGNVKMWWWVAPSDYSDMQYGFTTHRDLLGTWGYMAWWNEQTRDAMHVNQRSWWMLYHIADPASPNVGKIYKLCNIALGWNSDDLADNSNWIELQISWSSVKMQDVEVTTNWQTTFTLTYPIQLPGSRTTQLFVNWQKARFGTQYNFQDAQTLIWYNVWYTLSTTDVLELYYT